MAKERRELSDLEQMRAVSHPARWRVLEELWAGRTLTATEAGALVGLSSSAMSYHLHQLARLGLIEHDESTDGREHPWKASDRGVFMTGQPDAPLGRTMMQNVSIAVSRVLAAGPPPDGDSTPWPASFSHQTLRLTRDQAKQLHQQIGEVIAQFERASDASSDDAETFEYEAFWIQGVAQHEPPSTSGSSPSMD